MSNATSAQPTETIATAAVRQIFGALGHPRKYDYEPDKLPCGKEINRGENPPVYQCCRTECPNKNNDQIEMCYAVHKELKGKEEVASESERNVVESNPPEMTTELIENVLSPV
jgi:hypothetical protein